MIKLNKLEKPYTIKPQDRVKISLYSIKEKNTQNTTSDKKSKKSTNKNESIFVSNKNNKFIWPVKGKVVSTFGAKPKGLYNDGINIKAQLGTGVKVVEDGIVAYVGNELRGYGNLIIVKHSKNWISAYAHLNRTLVSRGDKVNKGNIIGEVGATGNVPYSQLYFGIRKGKNAKNPILYLKKQ